MDDRRDGDRQGLCLWRRRQQTETGQVTQNVFCPRGPWETGGCGLSSSVGPTDHTGRAPCWGAGSLVSTPPDGAGDGLKSLPHSLSWVPVLSFCACERVRVCVCEKEHSAVRLTRGCERAWPCDRQRGCGTGAGQGVRGLSPSSFGTVFCNPECQRERVKAAVGKITKLCLKKPKLKCLAPPWCVFTQTRHLSTPPWGQEFGTCGPGLARGALAEVLTTDSRRGAGAPSV